MSQKIDDEYIANTVRHYSDMMMRIAFPYVKNNDDAEDIVQEVFIKLIKQPIQTDSELLKAWLIRATINKSKDFLRSRKSRNTTPLDESYMHVAQETKTTIEHLSQLNDDDRNVLYLFYYEGYSASQISKILNKKEGAVYMHLSRARANLKKLMEEEK